MWSLKGLYHALLPKTDYRDKGRGHDRRLLLWLIRMAQGYKSHSTPVNPTSPIYSHPIDLFSLYVLFSQYRQCDNTLENSVSFKLWLLYVHISYISYIIYVKFPLDLYWINKTYKLKRSIQFYTLLFHPYPSPLLFHFMLNCYSFLHHLILSHPILSPSVTSHLFNLTPSHPNAPHPELQPISWSILSLSSLLSSSWTIIFFLLINDRCLSWTKMSALESYMWNKHSA